MEFVLLADAPAALGKVAGWYYNKWGRKHKDVSLQNIAAKLTRSDNREQVPLLMLVRHLGQIVAAGELKWREMPQFEQYPVWMGGIYVDKHWRGLGIASHLVAALIEKAKTLGITELYLQTEDLSGGIYAKSGFKPIHQLESNGKQVVVMRLQIDKLTTTL
ncbi:GNAT family N-acetyltransferase [Neptunicella marina]|uniref:GNAT family N-acetyltransferase n=1 Tax=Neptunicella marina TaxID=2125989 RepID=A0A8J6IX53_9ALTE|nr:GNAT family N-acetyltransferase [Neptunicella marina]MBC3767081.1 GNAT family N-acetyltransferase [Neptunicella marina]